MHCQFIRSFQTPLHLLDVLLSTMDMEELNKLFSSIGLDPQKSLEAAKNKKLSGQLYTILEHAGLSKGSGCDRAKGMLYYLLATKLTKESLEHLDFLINEISSSNLKSEAQLEAALRYTHCTNNINRAEFDRLCGIGVTVSQDEISSAVEQVLLNSKDILGKTQPGLLIRQVKEVNNIKWADSKLVKQIFDERYAKAIASLDSTKESSAVVEEKEGDRSTAFRTFEGDVLRLHRPGENKQKTAEIMRRHLEATGGKVITRFPPEPNGFLHIGHAKAINLNFRYAEAHDGHCYLRYDDTNPEAEEELYFKSILDTVEWLGFKPWKITYASDYFPELFEYAIDLIKRGKAYVCHMTPEEIKESRGGEDMKGARWNSPWRDRPIEESLRLFDEMHRGLIEEGKATLRMRQDMQNTNPFMWDLVAYRILKHPHVRTGDKWIIYPTYDFTHCLCDSLENITHSLCTTEFIKAHECYDWVCDSLDVYKAFQWEYSRLNLTNTILSKRKLTKLVQKGIVNGWDDPRIYTLAAVRRRGFSPRAINNFVERLGVTTSSSTVDIRLLEHCVREELNESAPRLMAVLDAIPVEIKNSSKRSIFVPYFPTHPEKKIGELTGGDVEFSERIYIDSSDFRVDGKQDPEYRRLYPDGCVGLLRANCIIKCTGYETDRDGKVTLIKAECINEIPEKATFIQWVPEDSVKCEVRLYSELFKSRNPSDNPDGWLADINSNSLLVKQNVLVDRRVIPVGKPGATFQFIRVGYFCVDPDSKYDSNGNPEHLVFNRTVPLKE